MQWKKDKFIISDEPENLNINTICEFLARSYWADKRPRDVIEKSIRHSINFGVYDGGRQVGYARVASDHATFAYLMDVFIDEEYRGLGLGKWLMECILAHPELQGLRRWGLATRDAHSLYSQFGFTPLSDPSIMMEKVDREK